MKLPQIDDLPFKMIALAVIITLAANIFELHRTNDELNKALTNQQNLIANAQTVENQLNSLAKGTKQLAESGDANAKRVVETLQANGVAIN